ncbi:hypothetical protein [Pseudomonas reinekei]|jgi:DNA-binding winged helix-turn-helix (wHTH) protein|nr:hypothetical protein [Pseudomonas reinekei]
MQYAFEDFVLDPERRELTVLGQVVAIVAVRLKIMRREKSQMLITQCNK